MICKCKKWNPTGILRKKIMLAKIASVGEDIVIEIFLNYPVLFMKPHYKHQWKQDYIKYGTSNWTTSK